MFRKLSVALVIGCFLGSYASAQPGAALNFGFQPPADGQKQPQSGFATSSSAQNQSGFVAPDVLKSSLESYSKTPAFLAGIRSSAKATLRPSVFAAKWSGMGSQAINARVSNVSKYPVDKKLSGIKWKQVLDPAFVCNEPYKPNPDGYSNYGDDADKVAITTFSTEREKQLAIAGLEIVRDALSSPAMKGTPVLPDVFYLDEFLIQRRGEDWYCVGRGGVAPPVHPKVQTSFLSGEERYLAKQAVEHANRDGLSSLSSLEIDRIRIVYGEEYLSSLEARTPEFLRQLASRTPDSAAVKCTSMIAGALESISDKVPEGAHATASREWSTIDGKYKVVGWAKAVDKTNVTIVKLDGKESVVPIAKLSLKDRNYCEALALIIGDF